MVYATNSAGYQAIPTEQPLAEELYADVSPIDAGLAARAKSAALRAYADAAAKSFAGRGELSSDLEAINQLEDFNYSPAALEYLQNYQNALTGYAGPYSLSSMDLNKSGPYTTADLERYAAMGDPLSRMYANFNLSGQNDAWDVGNLQFAPNQNYRIVDRSTGEVLYSGKGYEAGEKISGIASGLFDSSGKMADWAIEQQGPEGGEWAQRYEHDPETSGFSDFLLAAAPFATMGLLSGLGVLAPAAATGSAHAGIGATIGAGGLANAAPGLATLGAGTAAGAAGLAAPTLGAGALGSLAAPITVVAPATGGLSATALGGLAAGSTAAAGGLGGSATNSAATQAVPDEIVVEAPASTVPGGLPVDITSGALAGIGAGVGAIPPNAATPTAPSSGGLGLGLSDYLQLAGLGLSALGGGGGGSGSAGKIPGGAFGSLNPLFSKTLPQANLPGAGDLTPRAMPVQDWNTYAMRPEQSFFNYVPQNPQGFADGGGVEGPGTGRSDSIPAVLSDGEYVIDAETVALLGDGSPKAGADRLDNFRVNIRKHKGRDLSRGKISPDAKRPEQYFSGGLA
jgi:hypothetical protein